MRRGVDEVSLRELWTPLVFRTIEADRRVNGRDVQTFIHTYYRPLMTIPQLAISAGRPQQTMRESVGRLVDAGWAYIHTEPGRTRGGVIVPWMPVNVERQLVSLLAQRRTSVLFYGEWLMRCFLDLNVKDLVFHDDAHPQWQTTPEGRRLQLDRWHYVANVAFEFQGRQHFQKDNEFVQTASDLSRRYEYDGEKIRLCSLNSVELIEMTASDLDHHRIRAKLERKLPLTPVREKGPLFRELMGMGRQYMGIANRR